MRQFLYGIGLLVAAAVLDRSVSLRCRQPSVATDTPDRRRTAGHRRTPLGVASSAHSRLFARGRARDLPRGRYCLALCDVTGRMGRSSYSVDLDHPCRYRRLRGCRRSCNGATAPATAAAKLGAVQMTATPVDKTYVMLMVADMARAMGFYTEAFAVTVVINSPYWSEFVVAGTTIALHPGGSGSETHTGLGFEVQDLDAALQRVIQIGGRITSSPRERAQERIRVAEIADTEGNLITVAELIN
jgi:predicted enzyme related to lactoylglutathione lyase